MLSRFHLIPERHGQTDGQMDRRQTDRQNCYINIARQCVDAGQKPYLCFQMVPLSVTLSDL